MKEGKYKKTVNGCDIHQLTSGKLRWIVYYGDREIGSSPYFAGAKSIAEEWGR